MELPSSHVWHHWLESDHRQEPGSARDVGQRASLQLIAAHRSRCLPAAAAAVLFCLQKWSKGKMKEKVNNAVLFDKVSNRSSAAALGPAAEAAG